MRIDHQHSDVLIRQRMNQESSISFVLAESDNKKSATRHHVVVCKKESLVVHEKRCTATDLSFDCRHRIIGRFEYRRCYKLPRGRRTRFRPRGLRQSSYYRVVVTQLNRCSAHRDRESPVPAELLSLERDAVRRANPVCARSEPHTRFAVKRRCDLHWDCSTLRFTHDHK